MIWSCCFADKGNYLHFFCSPLYELFLNLLTGQCQLPGGQPAADRDGEGVPWAELQVRVGMETGGISAGLESQQHVCLHCMYVV